MFVERKILKNMDWTLLVTILLIISFGIISISSAITVKSGVDYWEKQILWALVGLVVMVLVQIFHYEDLAKGAKIIYVLNVLMLALVAIIGREAKGAESWINLGPVAIQPSEFAKIFVIITFASYLSQKQGELRKFRDLIPCFIHVGIPMIFILAQPDLGTALVFVAIMFGMLFVGGARPLYLILIIIFGLTMAIGGVYLHQNGVVSLPLKEHQLERLTIFTNPESDPRGAGYQVLQSQIAIGSGGISGKGLYKGTQNKYDFLPEDHTDFIFSVIGEELGFVGSTIVLGLMFIMLHRGIRIAAEAKDFFGTLVATGIVSMFLFHIFENVGMTVSLMPITGIPLPLVSYGGSSMVTNMISVGLLLNIYLRRQKIMF